MSFSLLKEVFQNTIQIKRKYKMNRKYTYKINANRARKRRVENIIRKPHNQRTLTHAAVANQKNFEEKVILIRFRFERILVKVQLVLAVCDVAVRGARDYGHDRGGLGWLFWLGVSAAHLFFFPSFLFSFLSSFSLLFRSNEQQAIKI